jgi:pimeloyl-ACP methyl ester carboxylesterase
MFCIRLADGRRLGFAQYGDPQGAPIFSFHGGLSSRLDAAFAAPLCAARGVRLISVDRPGIGLSDLQPGRALLDWPDDVHQLAAAIALERFAVFGWSAGGPYALACAYALPRLVTRVGIAGGMRPIDRPGAARDLGLRLDRILFALARRSPRAAALLLGAVRASPPRLLRWGLLRELPAADRRVLATLSVSEATAFVYEAFRSGVRGTVEDYRVLGEPWSFDLEAIASEVLLWHGEQDHLVPLAHATYLKDHLWHARLILVPRRGHFLPRTEMGDIVEALIRP